MSKLLLAVCFFSLIILESKSQEVGSSCEYRNDGDRKSPGICTPLKKCQIVVDRYNDHNIIPQLCKRRGQITCCPIEIPPPTRPSCSRISHQKCFDYRLKSGVCAKSSVPLIVGGDLAGDREFPHMALIGHLYSENDFSYTCGGSLISERFILSAAHCSYSGELKQATHAKLGDVRRGENSTNVLLVRIETRIPHPQYIKSQSIDHDIALFKLKQTVVFTEYIRPICLPCFDEVVERAVVTGWGSTGFGEELTKALMKVTLSIFNQTDCQSKFPRTGVTKNGIDEDTKICAGSYIKIADSCGGDSGGPLQIDNRDNINCMYTITGIVAFGHTQCGAIGIPGVYTRVFYYLDWIENIVWPQ